MSNFIRNLSDSSKTALLEKIAEDNPSALTSAFNSLAGIENTPAKSENYFAAIDRHIIAGEKNAAIREYREITGVRYHEANEWVEKRANSIGWSLDK